MHRARLFAQHLPSYGWEPTILTVHENYYEEKLDYNLEKLLPKNLQIVKVSAIKRFGPIGDIGLRAFRSLYKKAKELLLSKEYDFLYIPIPSFYTALLGRLLHNSTGIKYGIDYIDPWVHEFPGSKVKWSRAWWATKLANFLEPIAVQKASLITGVAENYYLPVIDRNKALENVLHGAMPYGGEINDHHSANELGIEPYLFVEKDRKFQFVYAGAMLPKAYEPLEKICRSIAANPVIFEDIEFHFIGTGKSPNDALGFNIKQLAEQYGLWNKTIFEYPARIPYLDVLVHLNNADAVFVLGSTEPHYTPSKMYQGILSCKPILAVLHEESTAAGVLVESNAGVLIKIGNENTALLENSFINGLNAFQLFYSTFNFSQVNQAIFEKYSAAAVTKELATLLDKVIEQ